MQEFYQDYIILEHNDRAGLMERVNKYLDKGYQLVGGISVIILDKNMMDQYWYLYSQAIAKPRAVTIRMNLEHKAEANG